MKTPDEALEHMLSQASPVSEAEWVDTRSALGRVLAEPLVSAVDVPPWDNSAMDGYAVNSADLTTNPCRLRISQRIPAGASGTGLEPGTAARVFTGAPLPRGADTVVIQEACERDGNEVTIRKSPGSGANVRRAGEDSRKGEEVLSTGIRLGSQHLGLAASVGIGTLSVYRRLRVALIASGDELVMPGEPLGPGQIYNSNQFILAGLLRSLGCELVDLGVVEDGFDATCDALSRGAGEADLVLTSGGVSVGEEDHIQPAVETLGAVDLWKVAIRPGKPLAFGHIGGTPFVGLPGNPGSLFVTFCLFARPFILRSQGICGEVTPAPVVAKADFDWPKANGRREFARARLESRGGGEPWVRLFPSHSSAMLRSLAWANGLAVIPEMQTLSRGDSVQFLPFSELLT